MLPAPWPAVPRPLPVPRWRHVALGVAVARRLSRFALPKKATVYLTQVTQELEGEPCEAIRYENERWALAPREHARRLLYRLYIGHIMGHRCRSYIGPTSPVAPIL